jgi:hypothetical protein
MRVPLNAPPRPERTSLFYLIGYVAGQCHALAFCNGSDTGGSLVQPSQDMSFYGLGFLAITPSIFDRKYQSSCFQAGVASE